jgi:GAF domain-containing protein
MSTQTAPVGEPSLEPAAWPVASAAARLRETVGAVRDVLRVRGIALVLLDEEDRAREVTAIGDDASRLVEAEWRLGVGPAVDVVAEGAPVTVVDLQDEPRYVGLGCRETVPAARAVLSVPVRLPGGGPYDVMGTLDLVHDRPHTWSTVEVGTAEAFAGAVAALLQFTACVGHAGADDRGGAGGRG